MATKPTFSVSVKGAVSPYSKAPLNTIIPDFDEAGNVVTTAGGQAQSMSRSTQFLCQGPDGGLHWYKFDVEHSTQGNPVLIFVGP